MATVIHKLQILIRFKKWMPDMPNKYVSGISFKYEYQMEALGE